MRNFAQLDGEGVLAGFVQIDDAAPDAAVPPPNRVEVPMACDLAPGRYRWDGRSFVPLVVDDGERLQQLNGVKAIALGLMAVRDSGLVALPPYTLEWLGWYAQTFDYGGG
jgi:hypothetical protein